MSDPRGLVLVGAVMLAASVSAGAATSDGGPPGPDAAEPEGKRKADEVKAGYDSIVGWYSDNELVWDGLPSARQFIGSKKKGRDQWVEFRLPPPGVEPLLLTGMVVQGDAVSFDLDTDSGAHALYGRVPARLHDAMQFAGTANGATGEPAPTVRIFARLDYVRNVLSDIGVTVAVPQLRIMAVWVETGVLWTASELKIPRKRAVPAAK